jgi:hypothetical protein
MFDEVSRDIPWLHPRLHGQAGVFTMNPGQQLLDFYR